MRGTDAQLILGHTIFMAGKTQSLLSHGNLSFRCVWDEHHDTYLIEKGALGLIFPILKA